MDDDVELTRLACSDNNRFIQIKAIGKVKDSEVLEDLAANARDWQVRFEAIKYIDNQAIFIDRALNDRRCEVRQLAATRINDEDVLIKIALTDIDNDVSLTALGKIKSYSNWLHALNHCKHPQICKDISDGVFDEKVLENLTLNHHSHKVRRVACREITNPDVLKKVVCFEKYWDIRKLAFERIDDPEAFRYIAKNASNPMIAKAALYKSNEKT